MDEEYKKEKIVNNLCLDNTNLKLEIRKLKKELAIKEVEINDLKEKKLDLSEEDLNNNFYQFSPTSFSAINSEYSDQKIVYQLKNAFDIINSLQKEKDKEADLSERKIKELNNEIQKIKQDNLLLTNEISNLNDKIISLSKKTGDEIEIERVREFLSKSKEENKDLNKKILNLNQVIKKLNIEIETLKY